LLSGNAAHLSEKSTWPVDPQCADAQPKLREVELTFWTTGMFLSFHCRLLLLQCSKGFNNGNCSSPQNTASFDDGKKHICCPDGYSGVLPTALSTVYVEGTQ
jgi:hypothetical protein